MKSIKKNRLINKLRRIFATRLAVLRKAKSMTQAELGKEAHINQDHISQFERGVNAPSFDNLCRLADALDADIDYLIGRSSGQGQSNRATVALLRYAKKASDKDLKLLTQMAKMLVKRNRKW